MNMKKIKEQLEAFCSESNILPEKLNEWCDVISLNYSMFKKNDWNGIYEILDSFKIDGIDEQIKQKTASIIADVEGADMNIDQNVATVFMAYTKKNIK